MTSVDPSDIVWQEPLGSFLWPKIGCAVVVGLGLVGSAFLLFVSDWATLLDPANLLGLGILEGLILTACALVWLYFLTAQRATLTKDRFYPPWIPLRWFFQGHRPFFLLLEIVKVQWVAGDDHVRVWVVLSFSGGDEIQVAFTKTRPLTGLDPRVFGVPYRVGGRTPQVAFQSR